MIEEMPNQKFRTTLGHEKQKLLFLRLLENNRLAHAYAFVGSANIGKTTFALELAQILGAHPLLDMFVFDSEEEGLQIEQARSIQNHLSLTPVENLKVAIITHAERMTLAAANSLLKTLEEPPAKSILILTCENFYSLLPTIASRLERINFGRLSDDEVSESLKDLRDEQKNKEIIMCSSGRIGMAQRLAHDPKAFELLRDFATNYHSLTRGDTLTRLKTSEKLSLLETNEISAFLKFAMWAWTRAAEKPQLGQNLFQTYEGLALNLNIRLLLDNLFLSAK